MDKTTLGLLGAAAALAALSAPVGANAGPVDPARSFAELLEPIPNAAARLKAAGETPPAPPPVADEDCQPRPPMNRAGQPTCVRAHKPPPAEKPAPPAQPAG